MGAAFLSDMRFVTSGVDKLMIMWEIQNEQPQEVGRIETRNYQDIVTSVNKFVSQGMAYFQVFPNNNFEDNYEHELNDTVTSLALTRDGRFLLANISLK